MFRRISMGLAGVAMVAVLSGCGLTYSIVKPTVSSLQYANTSPDKLTIKIIDKRTGDDTLFMKRTANLKNVNISLEYFTSPISYLAENLEKELNARSIKAVCIVGGNEKGDIALEVDRFEIINRRVSGYSPWEAFHCFKGSITTATGTFPIHAFFFNGKVPVWSMKEIEEPCINLPLSILIKEIASKINRVAIGAKASDQAVEDLAKSIQSEVGKNDNGPFWKVFELAATNNPSAMEHLKKFTIAQDNFLKACVFSAIGTLGPQDQFDFLKQCLAKTDEVSKFMDLKSIGDIERQEAKDFLKKIAETTNEDGVKICSELYAK
jgi:hypothetical protein